MKRDMDLVRQILFVAEDARAGGTVESHGHQRELGPWDFGTVAEHVLMLHRAGFIEAMIRQTTGIGTPVNGWTIHRISFEGYEFLETVRDAGTWAKVKEAIVSKGGPLSVEIIKAVAIGYARQRLSLMPQS